MNQTDKLKELAGLIAELRSLTDRAQKLASSHPAASRTLCVLMQHLETLEVEIGDPLRVLEAAGRSPEASSRAPRST